MESEQTPVEQEPKPEPARRRTGVRPAHVWTALIVVALVFLVVLIVENTRRVKVGWVFGYSQISLVYLVVFATVLGWVLGIATSVVLRRRARRPPSGHR